MAFAVPVTRPYFKKYEFREPNARPPIGKKTEAFWQFFAVIALYLGATYMFWRITSSFNEAAPVFSCLVLGAEALAFIGLVLFYFDIWAEGDTETQPPPKTARDIGLQIDREIQVDVFITTFDEPVSVVEPTIQSALALETGDGYSYLVHLLDDGHRSEMQTLSETYGINYLSRPDNRGYKAGNLKEALFATEGDLIVICDADTRLFPSFVANTLGYFRDQKVSWVQTPHWFYDIPEGRRLSRTLLKRSPGLVRRLFNAGLVKRRLPASGSDPFMNNPDFFFDVIQRRRNRNAASFCCGAGSIHRRSSVLQVALSDQATAIDKSEAKLRKQRISSPSALLRANDPKPFEFHVSEDLCTSIRHQKHGWKSVYHPMVEARMLSPRTISAWSMQRMKYAGGTFDIMARANPMLMKGMPWQTKLHYLSTFWSYLSVLWLPILLLSPAVSLLTGWSPVKAYSLEFFQHLVPFLVAHEVAVLFASKGYDVNLGRSMSIGLLPMHLKAAWNVLRGRKPTFVPTPKIPLGKDGQNHLIPHLAVLAIFCFAAGVGITQHQRDIDGYSTAFIATNLLWLLWNTTMVWRTARILFWNDPAIVSNTTGQGQ